MAIKSIPARGYGPGSSVKAVVTRGYSIAVIRRPVATIFSTLIATPPVPEVWVKMPDEEE